MIARARLLARCLLVALLGAGGPGCGGTLLGSDGGDPSDLPPSDAGAPRDLVPGPDLLAPPRPQLGDAIDRLGRPLVTTMLTDLLDFDNKRDVVNDAYNHDGAASGWAARYQSRLADSLAIFDLLDGACGNQALYDRNLGGVDFTVAGYGALASVLADDELYLNTRASTCTYLGVEQAVWSQKPITDCGGRPPASDIVDQTYTVLSGSPQPLGDGVALDPDHAPTATFPFFAPPSGL